MFVNQGRLFWFADRIVLRKRDSSSYNGQDFSDYESNLKTGGTQIYQMRKGGKFHIL